MASRTDLSRRLIGWCSIKTRQHNISRFAGVSDARVPSQLTSDNIRHQLTQSDVCQHATAEFPQSESGLSSQLVVVIAAIVIATPVSAATGAASHTCVRHGCQ